VSKQQFSAIEREAIFVAYGKKCAYTREPLDFATFHIDHILPESLSEEPARFEEIKKQLNIGEFNLRGFGNLVPCKPEINLQKGHLIFEPAHVHYFLGVAAYKVSAIEKNIALITTRNAKGKALIILQRCLDTGQLTVKEVAGLLDKYQDNTDELFKLIVNMRFADETEVSVISKSDIDGIKDLSMKFGRNDHIDGLYLVNKNEERQFVRTCRQYIEAIRSGFHPSSGFDIKIAAYLEHYCGLLVALDVATIPAKSYISMPYVTIANMNLMPFDLFPQLGDTVIPEEGTYQDHIDKHNLRVCNVTSSSFNVESEYWGHSLVEAVRADFNNDGIEDVLCFEYSYATKGTLGYGGIKILTRLSPTGHFELAIPEFRDVEHLIEALRLRA